MKQATEYATRPAATAETSPSGARRPGRRRLPSALGAVALVVALIALSVAWRRLFLGTDLNDEGFSIALPYRFALGARPFVDEQSVLQTAAFFAYPFVKLYVVLTGGDDGIVLFTRHLYLAWVTMVSVVAAVCLRRLARWETVLPACLVCATFVFVSTTNLSYNTLGAGFLVLGMACGARAVASDGRSRWLIAAGVAQALAAFAYPTLGAALPVSAACLVLAAPGRRWSALRAWALGAGAMLALEGLVLVACGLGNVLRCLRDNLTGWHTLNTVSGPAKVWGVVSGVVDHLVQYPLAVVLALLLWLVYRRYPGARAALVAVPLVLLPFGEHLVSGADGFGVAYGMLAPYFAMFVPAERRTQAARLLVWGYIPALAAALVSGYSSANGWLQTDVGLLPAMVLSGVFLALALAPRAGEQARLARLLPGLALVCLSGILAITLVYQYQFLPRAVPYGRLTVTVHGGPYAGVRTTPLRAAYLEQLRRDLPQVASPADRVLFFYQVPAFYLFWPHRVATDTVWLSSVEGLSVMDDPGPLPPATLAYYRREHVLPDVVVRVIATAGLSHAQLERYRGGLDYDIVLVRPQYVVFRRPPRVTTLDDALRGTR